MHGIAAAPGAAAARPYIYQPDAYEIPASWSDGAHEALSELGAALDMVAASLADAATRASGEPGEILHAQAAIAADRALRAAAEKLTAAGEHPARAILDAGAQFASTLERSGNDYLSARAPDVRQICDLAARSLAGAPARTSPHPTEPCVLVADDLMPRDMAALDPHLVRAIVTEHGGRTSHTSVIARALGIPAVAGAFGAVADAATAARVAVDGSGGEVIFDPDGPTLTRIDEVAQAERVRRGRLRAAAGEGKAGTADGVRVEVAANVSGIEELRTALAEGAEGVGLLRTELLYEGALEPPAEAAQVKLLMAMRELLGDRRLIVRTFDIGADKQVSFLPVRPERNPELGLRGLRLARMHPALLDTQLRAIAAVAPAGPTAVMAPMVATVDDVRWFRARVAAAGMPEDVEVGVMVEVPALALIADRLAAHVDFLSIGTNDLAQYLFAADRRDEAMGELLDPFSPALLRAVASVCRGVGDGAWVGVCGEAASDPGWALLAVGLGVRELSMPGVAVPAVRSALKAVTLDACRDAATRALDAADRGEARAIAATLVEEGA